MLKKTGIFAAAALGLIAPAAIVHAEILGPDAAACRPGSDMPALVVTVEGFKSRTGDVRVQVYGGDPKDFLVTGKKLKRIDLPVTAAGAMSICVAVPAPGNYAVAVRHDVDGGGKSGWNDGAGFSRNPKISLTSLKPRYDQVVIGVGREPRPIAVVLNYRRGLSISPIAMASR